MQTPHHVQDKSPPSASRRSEPLACSSCRSRKLKCDRLKPACSRCAKVKNECVYPESRRKPAFKRRNVRELETRLEKLEGLLKDAGRIGMPAENVTGNAAEHIPNVEIPNVESQGGSSPGIPEAGTTMWCGGDFDLGESFMTNLLNGDMPPVDLSLRDTPFSTSPDGGLGSFAEGELMGLGQFEALPPFEMIEELHRTFFQRQSYFIPIIHKGRYLQAFHSAPHMRPPMCLQYAIWTMASSDHEKYRGYHDIFYHRTRQYLEADELKGYGEHFLTIAHLQAWALAATSEARRMFFTRAGMSSARCVRLAHMMGLHRLDDDSPEARLMTPTIGAAQSWAELEERRRCFWAVFCIDSHGSISTGWPNLIDMNEVTTRLPSSEEAFNAGREEKPPTLEEGLRGAEYSTFASSAVSCHIFIQILKHVHRPTPNDRPDDVNQGPFWKKHRELDNLLSSAFMFLPERFRLPKNIGDPIALHSNLNLHAAIICLHNAACDKADQMKLPDHVKKTSQDRSLTAAQEIINIMKLTSDFTKYRSPLISLSLYCATSTYVHQAKDNQGRCDVENLEFLVNCMVAISREHLITRSYLQQTLLDIERNDVVGISLDTDLSETVLKTNCAYNIPLLARSSIANHSDIQPPLPGRLPLGKPQSATRARRKDWRPQTSSAGRPAPAGGKTTSADSAAAAAEPGAKRKRRSPTSAAAAAPARSRAGHAASTTSTSSSSPGPSVFGFGPVAGIAALPHRTSSPAAAPAVTAAPAMPAPILPQQQLLQVPDLNMLRMFQVLDDQWDMGDLGSIYEHVSELARSGPGVDDGSATDEPWPFPTGDGGGGGLWDAEG